MRRHLLALITIGLLVAAAVLYLTSGGDDASRAFLSGLCMRAGLVCGALWVAYDQVLPLLSKRPSALTWAIILGVLMVIINKNLAIVALILVAAVGVLQGIKWLFTPFESRKQGTAKRTKSVADTTPK